MMTLTRRLWAVALFVGWYVALDAQPAWACPVCFGAVDSPMMHGMNWAIFLLLGVIGTVACGFLTFFVYLFKRSRATLGQGMRLPSPTQPRGSF